MRTKSSLSLGVLSSQCSFIHFVLGSIKGIGCPWQYGMFNHELFALGFCVSLVWSIDMTIYIYTCDVTSRNAFQSLSINI